MYHDPRCFWYATFSWVISSWAHSVTTGSNYEVVTESYDRIIQVTFFFFCWWWDSNGWSWLIFFSELFRWSFWADLSRSHLFLPCERNIYYGAIRTADLRGQKQPIYHPCYNHCHHVPTSPKPTQFQKNMLLGTFWRNNLPLIFCSLSIPAALIIHQ